MDREERNKTEEKKMFDGRNCQGLTCLSWLYLIFFINQCSNFCPWLSFVTNTKFKIGCFANEKVSAEK